VHDADGGGAWGTTVSPTLLGCAAVGFYDWMLALHVLSAFAVAAALVLYSVLVVAGRRMDTLEDARLLFRVAPVGGPLIGAGMGFALLLGIVLAIDADAYQLWDAWVIIAIVLWALMGWAGQRTGAYYTAVQEFAESSEASAGEVMSRLRAPTGASFHLLTIAVFLLLLLDMIFKPWA
jgi:hypothetical protein